MKYIPNSFQIANAVVDDLLCLMSGNAWKCYGVIVRKTTGWQKEMDYISVSQFKTLTGIKKDETVTDALKELEELNLIASVKQRGKVTGYRLNMPELPPENGGTTTPKNWVHPKMGTTPKNWGVLPPENGGTTTPEKGGSTKHTIKPTNTKYSISASAAADAPLPAKHSESGERAATVKAKPTKHETELSLLADYGIAGQVAADFLQVRKAKRQPLTETAMKLLAADAEKCGMT
ncbi:TPA: replication protein, partial [Neisseria meningitidis]